MKELFKTFLCGLTVTAPIALIIFFAIWNLKYAIITVLFFAFIIFTLLFGEEIRGGIDERFI